SSGVSRTHTRYSEFEWDSSRFSSSQQPSDHSWASPQQDSMLVWAAGRLPSRDFSPQQASAVRAALRLLPFLLGSPLTGRLLCRSSASPLELSTASSSPASRSACAPCPVDIADAPAKGALHVMHDLRIVTGFSQRSYSSPLQLSFGVTSTP